MAAVRSSSRVSIAWESAPAYEDTDTLVLTIHDYSLDLRVFTSGPQIGQIDWSTVAKVSELEGSTTGTLLAPIHPQLAHHCREPDTKMGPHYRLAAPKWCGRSGIVCNA